MELTFATELGQTFSVEIDPQMELENVMALLEAEVCPLSFSRCVAQSKAFAIVWHPRCRTKHLLRRSRADKPQGDDEPTRSARPEPHAPAPEESAEPCWKVKEQSPFFKFTD